MESCIRTESGDARPLEAIDSRPNRSYLDDVTKHPPSRERTDLLALLVNLGLSRPSGLRVRVNARHRVPEVEVDRRWMRRVFNTLFANVETFSDRAGDARLALAHDRGEVTVTLVHEGTPRGLAAGVEACRAMVEQHGGRITARHDEGHRIFRLSLPALR